MPMFKVNIEIEAEFSLEKQFEAQNTDEARELASDWASDMIENIPNLPCDYSYVDLDVIPLYAPRTNSPTPTYASYSQPVVEEAPEVAAGSYTPYGQPVIVEEAPCTPEVTANGYAPYCSQLVAAQEAAYAPYTPGVTSNYTPYC